MKVIFIDTVHPILQDQLEAIGFSCHWYHQHSIEEIKRDLPEYDGLVIRSRIPVDKKLLDLASNLKFIARSGAGLENIDLDYAAQKGILCFSAPEGNRDAVAEHGIGMLLSLFNHMNRADKEVRAGIWKREENRGVELKGKTVGIIGYGYMGKAFAERLIGFGVKILVYDKYKSGFGHNHIEEVSLQSLQEKADVISFHLPLTEETQFMCNTSFIDKCAKPIYVLNTARGKIIETKALVEALKNEKVLGACLDVLEYEKSSFEQLHKEQLPESFAYLVNSDKVLLSPHVAGWTIESYVKLSSVLGDKIKAHYIK